MPAGPVPAGIVRRVPRSRVVEIDANHLTITADRRAISAIAGFLAEVVE
jgi:hypothetical protein